MIEYSVHIVRTIRCLVVSPQQAQDIGGPIEVRVSIRNRQGEMAHHVMQFDAPADVPRDEELVKMTIEAYTMELWRAAAVHALALAERRMT